MLFRDRIARMDKKLLPLSWLLAVLPFMVGGFYAWGCAAVTVFLLGYLLWVTQKNRKFVLYLSDSLLAVCVLVLCYGLSTFWAEDRGMAAWGIVRYIPVLLFVLAILQVKADDRADIYCLVPLSAAIMTVAACILRYIPGPAELVTVDGRLAGFFAYPNVYAAFLETALVISATAADRKKRAIWTEAVFIFGVFASGSRTAFLLLIVILVLLCLVKKDPQYILATLSAFLICLLLTFVANRMGWNTTSDRYLTISADSSTMLGRFLYFADALKIIAQHPFGLGYLGYRAIQGSWQSGVYEVMFVHNWLFQLLLDVGWIPALAFLYAVIQSFFSKKTPWRNRLMILVILGHSMMDFDMEYLSMWLLLMPALLFRVGKPVNLKQGGKMAVAFGAAACLLCTWLAAGELLYRVGRVDMCLKITPFHTQALEYRLTQIQSAQELDQAADQVLRLKPKSSIAHSAKANAAFAFGEIQVMMDEKEQAIACARYRIDEYCDYFDKLYAAMQQYLKEENVQSARKCAEKLREIPEMLSELENQTSELAWRIADQPQLELPEAYQKLLAKIAG